MKLFPLSSVSHVTNYLVTQIWGCSTLVKVMYSNLICCRFLHRTPEELHHQANVSGPLPQRSVANFPPQNASESNTSPEQSPIIKTSLLDPGCSSAAGTIDSSSSGLTESPTVASMSVIQSTAENVNQNISMEISAGSISSYSMQMVLENQKEGIESNDLSMETSAVSSDATLSLSDHKEPNEVILVSC